MEYIVNTTEMRRAENITMNELHMPSIVLMEKAASCIVSIIEERFSKDKAIGIIAGTGNNGGDAVAVGRILLLRGWDVSFHLIGSEKKQTTNRFLFWSSIMESGGFSAGRCASRSFEH